MVWCCNDKRFHLKARSLLCDTDTDYSASPRRKRKNWGHLQLMPINHVYCIVLFVYLLRRGTRESMFTSVFVALVLVFGYV